MRRRVWVGVECGQRLHCRRSWSRPWWRRFRGGVAFGPIMAGVRRG